jgi:hypothetical protein
MAIGAAQACVFGAASALAFAGSTPRALRLLDRAARGAGTVLRFWPQRFYGDALARHPV